MSYEKLFEIKLPSVEPSGEGEAPPPAKHIQAHFRENPEKMPRVRGHSIPRHRSEGSPDWVRDPERPLIHSCGLGAPPSPWKHVTNGSYYEIRAMAKNETFLIGEPKDTAAYSREELRKKGVVGLYKRPKQEK